MQPVPDSLPAVSHLGDEAISDTVGKAPLPRGLKDEACSRQQGHAMHEAQLEGPSCVKPGPLAPKDDVALLQELFIPPSAGSFLSSLGPQQPTKSTCICDPSRCVASVAYA